MKRPIALLLVMILTACATPYSFVRIDDGPVPVGNRLIVKSNGVWNAFGGSAYNGPPIWTIDGLPLDNLSFFVDVGEGKPIAPVSKPSAAKGMVFKSAMAPHEIVGLFEVYLTADGSIFTLDKLEPAEFIDGKGFRFDFQLLRKDDSVTLRGTGLVAVRGGELFAILFTAPRLHYFESYLPRAMSVAQSAKLKN